MRSHVPVTFLAALGTLAWPAAPHAEPQAPPHEKAADIHVYTPDSIKWQDGPPSLPKGAKVAVLEGDLAKEGPFVLRAKMPDGYRVPPHTHPKAERVTVLAGTFYIGTGATFDAKAGRAMPAGSYGTWPAGMKHFGWAKGETVIQVHGTGPWSIQYVNPDDDPRKQRR
jgi:quercetin dioxygenase-like cupin family protein